MVYTFYPWWDLNHQPVEWKHTANHYTTREPHARMHARAHTHARMHAHTHTHKWIVISDVYKQIAGCVIGGGIHSYIPATPIRTHRHRHRQRHRQTDRHTHSLTLSISLPPPPPPSLCHMHKHKHTHIQMLNMHTNTFYVQSPL